MEYRNLPLQLVVLMTSGAVREACCEPQSAPAVAYHISASADNHQPISSHRGRQVYTACFDQSAHLRTSVRSAALHMDPLRDQRVSINTISPGLCVLAFRVSGDFGEWSELGSRDILVPFHLIEIISRLCCLVHLRIWNG